MNINKGFSILSVLISFITFNSCINEPDYSIIPQIGLLDRYLVVTQDPNIADTLFVVINFKDGDGDLGFSSDPRYSSTPFNELNLYLKNDGDTTKLTVPTTRLIADNKPVDILDIPGGASGHIVTLQTRDIPGNEDLPPYSDTLSTEKPFYTEKTFYVNVSQMAILRGNYTLVDTIDVTSGDKKGTYYGVHDTFYTKKNPYYYNIVVTFETRVGAESSPFNWSKTARLISPGIGRFPDLSNPSNPKGAIEGALTYGISDPDLLLYFDDQAALHLNIQVTDRALHRSNIVSTDEFLLSHIRK